MFLDDVINVLNFIFIANDMWITWSILIVILTIIISIGKNK